MIISTGYRNISKITLIIEFIQPIDLDKLEKLTIDISADFDKAFYPPGMNKAKQISIKTNTNWKADNRDEETIEITLNEIVDDYYLKTGIPEM